MSRNLRQTLVAALGALNLTGLLPMAPGMTIASTGIADPVDVVQCHLLRNGGACVNCCKEHGFPASACAHFCNTPLPPPPPDEPQP